MVKGDKKITEEQINSMNNQARFALNYHYYNIIEANGKRRSTKQEGSNKVRSTYRKVLHNEIIAYVNWLGRIYYFSKNMKKEGYLEKNEFGNEFEKIENIRHKLTAHRAVDAPKRNEDHLNLSFSASFDRVGRFHNGEPEIPIINDEGDPTTFRPIEEHEKYIQCLENILTEINDNSNFNN